MSKIPTLAELKDSEHLCKENFLDDNGKYKDKTVTIRTIEKGEVYDPRKRVKVPKFIIYFEEGKKGMVLNVSCRSKLVEKFGNVVKNWVGKKVTLYVDPDVKFAGKVVGGIRVR